MVCAVESFYLPHGGKDEMCLTLSPEGGLITRTRSPESSAVVKLNRQCAADESLQICETLKELGAWELGDSHLPVIDGWRCTICLAEGETQHVIEMNVATEDHGRLISYLCSLLPIAEDYSGRLTDV